MIIYLCPFLCIFLAECPIRVNVKTLADLGFSGAKMEAHFYVGPAMPEPKESTDELISLLEAAKRYGLSRTYLRTIARSGRLKAKKLGRDWLTTPADLEAYIESREQRGAFRKDLGLDDRS
jgi:excisionase family DNA binding protein